MEPNKILSATILDLVFDGRNKEYGAYELRVTYPERVKKSMVIVFIITAIAITGAALGSSLKTKGDGRIIAKPMTIPDFVPEEKEKIPPPEKPKPDPPEIKSIKVTQPRIVDEIVPEPPPTEEDKAGAIISDITKGGLPDDGTIKTPEDIDKGTGIIEKKTEPEILDPGAIQVPARYDGDWSKFLTRNLIAGVPVENGAPVGTYKVIIQFVVDQQGNVSDITPITNYGFGMEQEAIRVLKKAKGWKAGIQNGHEVKSYHRQPITFVVE